MTEKEHQEHEAKIASYGDNWAVLLEDVIDTLMEVGNGATEECLEEALGKAFRIRDLLKEEKKKNV